MTDEEFSGPYWRLCAGFKQDVTPERSDVVYEAMKHLPARSWEAVVERALGGARMPDLDRLAKIAAEVSERDRKTASKKLICECGGRLDLPREPPIGVQFRDEPIEAEAFDEAVFAMDRRDRPERWFVAMLRRCSTCAKIYVLPGESRTIRRRDGSTVRVEKGKLIEPEAILPREDWERAGQGVVVSGGVPF